MKQVKDTVMFYSGGAGSFYATHVLLEGGFPVNKLHLLFTDTLIESKSHYIFLVESVGQIYGTAVVEETGVLKELPEIYEDFDKRKELLTNVAESLRAKIPNFHWVHYRVGGNFVSVWDIFENFQYMGNSRVAQCSNILKQRMAKDFIQGVFKDSVFDVALGIDWSESHRAKAPTEHWSKLAEGVLFPLIDLPYVDQKARLDLIVLKGLTLSDQYQKGNAHSNCGGFCVRAGQGHFKNLMENDPKLFEYHMRKEQELSDRIGGYTILKKQRDGEVFRYPLTELKRDNLKDPSTIDKFDLGGCGCFVTEVEADELRDGKWSVKDLKVFKGVREL